MGVLIVIAIVVAIVLILVGAFVGVVKFLLWVGIAILLISLIAWLMRSIKR